MLHCHKFNNFTTFLKTLFFWILLIFPVEITKRSLVCTEKHGIRVLTDAKVGEQYSSYWDHALKRNATSIKTCRTGS